MVVNFCYSIIKVINKLFIWLFKISRLLPLSWSQMYGRSRCFKYTSKRINFIAIPPHFSEGEEVSVRRAKCFVRKSKSAARLIVYMYAGCVTPVAKSTWVFTSVIEKGMKLHARHRDTGKR